MVVIHSHKYVEHAGLHNCAHNYVPAVATYITMYICNYIVAV